jgi:tetratricopeptide (TPR) repeat protein
MNPLRLKPNILLPAILLLIFPISVAQAEDAFMLGNHAYMHKDFTAAITYYQQTAATHGLSASLLYNMGNSYARLGKTGLAILAYEQALRLDHGNADIRSNLQTIRKKNGIYQQDQPLWQRLFDLLGTNQWLLLSGCSFFIFSCCLLLIAVLKKPGAGRIPWVLAICALLTTLLTLPPLTYGCLHWQDAVVLTKTRLKISPFAEAAPAAAIKEGQVVHPGKIYNDYILVAEFNGRKGWLPVKELGFLHDFVGTVEK